MSKIKKILVCSDFSSHSDKAIKAARDFALQVQSEVLVLHVAHTPFYMDGWGMESWISENMMAEILIKLDEMLKEQLENLNFKAQVRVTESSSITNSVLKVIKDFKPDIVFVGHKGMTGMESIFLGSVARKIVTMSPVPVMVIKKDESIKKNSCLCGRVRRI
jgi:nucleotide-binding universal stress UspA family protein